MRRVHIFKSGKQMFLTSNRPTRDYFGNSVNQDTFLLMLREHDHTNSTIIPISFIIGSARYMERPPSHRE